MLDIEISFEIYFDTLFCVSQKYVVIGEMGSHTSIFLKKKIHTMNALKIIVFTTIASTQNRIIK